MDLGSKDKVVFITGATGGIGKEVVRAFANEGAKLSITSTKQEKIDALVKELGLSEEQCLSHVIDVTEEEAVKAAVKHTVDHYGEINVLINIAGYQGKAAPITEQSYDDFMKVYSINVFGPVYAIKAAFPYMEKQGGGSIVTLVSDGAFVGAPGMSTYTSSKHAIAGITKSVALEGVDKNIRANYICPGPVDTDMMRRIERDTLGEDVSVKDAKAAFSAANPQKRYAKPEEVAALTLFAASDLINHVTAEGFRINGGTSATSR